MAWGDDMTSEVWINGSEDCLYWNCVCSRPSYARYPSITFNLPSPSLAMSA